MQGSSQGTGVAEPGKNMKNIQPKKAPIGKGRKKVITPGDIDSLFSKPTASASLDDDDDNEDYSNDDASSTTRELSADTSLLMASSDSLNSPSMDEEMPKWLADAEQAAKRKSKGTSKSRKKRRLTDDWRFWAAIIGTAGFVTAFISIYQQTGGLGSGDTGGQPGGEMLI